MKNNVLDLKKACFAIIWPKPNENHDCINIIKPHINRPIYSFNFNYF